MHPKCVCGRGFRPIAVFWGTLRHEEGTGDKESLGEGMEAEREAEDKEGEGKAHPLLLVHTLQKQNPI